MCPLVSGQDMLVKNCYKIFISSFGTEKVSHYKNMKMIRNNYKVHIASKGKYDIKSCVCIM